MHWCIQENLFHEEGMRELVETLERLELPYSLHKVVPFVGDLIPDINPDGPVIVFGSYSMMRTAKKRGWLPGAFANENFDFEVWRTHYGNSMLNCDAQVCRFDSVPERETFFMRPCEDTKSFAGAVFDWPEYQGWRERVVNLGEDTGTTLTGATRVMVSEPQDIWREYRLWIVDGKVVTASLYRLGGRVVYDSKVDGEVYHWGHQMARIWQPDRAFVMDVALADTGYKIVEINCINAAGFYAGNVGKIIHALENMGGYDGPRKTGD